MSKALANLLQEPDYKLARVIDKLESLSGYQSQDISLISQNQNRLRAKLVSRGLDPDDTNDQELLHALANKLQSDIEHIHRALKINQNDSVEDVAQKLLTLVDHYSAGQPALSVKSATAKRLLREQRPKRLMKLLKYRGLESMLKRENPGKLFALLPATESSSWNDRFASEIKKLTRNDYEMRPVEFMKFQIEASPTTRVGYVPLMGTVIFLPGKDIARRALEVIYQMLQAEEILQADTFYLKSHQLAGDFSSRACLVFKSFEPPMVKVAGHDFIKWHHLKDLFENAPSPLARLAKIHPAMNWWREAISLAQAKESVVSLHIGDVFKVLYHGADSTDACFNLKDSLKADLIARYAHHPAVKDYIAQQLDDKVIALDPADSSSALSPEMQTEFI